MPTKTRRTREGLNPSAETIKGLQSIATAVGLPVRDVLRLLAQEPDRTAALALEVLAREVAGRQRAVGGRLDGAASAGTVERAGHVPPKGVPTGPAAAAGEGRARPEPGSIARDPNGRSGHAAGAAAGQSRGNPS